MYITWGDCFSLGRFVWSFSMCERLISESSPLKLALLAITGALLPNTNAMEKKGNIRVNITKTLKIDSLQQLVCLT